MHEILVIFFLNFCQFLTQENYFESFSDVPFEVFIKFLRPTKISRFYSPQILKARASQNQDLLTSSVEIPEELSEKFIDLILWKFKNLMKRLVKIFKKRREQVILWMRIHHKRLWDLVMKKRKNIKAFPA